MVMHLLEDSFDKGLQDNPYECLSWNLLLGSSINLANLMQCLSDCCKAFMLVNLTSYNGQPVLTYLNLGFIYGNILIFQGVVIPLPGCKG